VSDPKPIATLLSAPRAVGAVFAAALLTVANTVRADVDPVVMFDGFDGCAPVQGEIGPEGGVLRLCGAQLTIPPDAVVEPTVFGIERLDEPGEAPFDMEFAGPAFRFTPLDPGLQQQASVRVPRADARHGGLAYFFPDDAQYVLIEACQVSAGGIQQFSGLLGDFAAVRYLGDLPENTQGLGDGTIQTTTGPIEADFDIDAPGNNYAIYQDREDGRRQITIASMIEGDQFEFVRFDLVIDFAAGTGELVQISRLGSIGGSYIVDLLGTASIAFGDLSDGRIRAEVVATLASGPEEIPFHASIDAAAERYIFPPSLQCPGGDFPPEG
jgi:hypothetical protein